MNNYPNNTLNNNGSTPIRRLGLSRKRRSSCLQINASVHSLENGETFSETEIKKPNIASADMCNKSSEVRENFGNKPEKRSELKPNTSDTHTKYAKEIEELENLYSIWANGFKNAFSYLVNLLEKRPGESVNVKKLLLQLRIWEIISDHFKGDQDLCYLLSDGEDTD